MIPELGQFALILAFILAGLQFVLPSIGVYNNNVQFMKLARPLSYGQSFFIFISFLCLSIAFYQDDFSLKYVATHSHSELPILYKLSAIWGGHEGSFLLWVLLLSCWTVAVSLSSKSNQWLSDRFVALLLAILGLLSLGFIGFLLSASSPFSRFLPNFPIEGTDLNPLLQDPGLVIHPPLLYIGYVGFAVPFAFMLALLIEAGVRQKEDIKNSLKWIRPFCLIAWSFLTLGVVLGSWWAYYELGFGGYWFWDPVENVSFIPWLTGTALIHCLIVSTKRQILYRWTIALGLLTFIFSLCGAFLVRSGVLSSVHSFASDPTRGIIILQFLLLVIGATIAVYALRIQFLIVNEKKYPLTVFSREALMLLNAIIFIVAAFSILLGTLYPIAYESITHKKISVGFPYFNMVFIPLMIPILCIIPLGPFTRWGENRIAEVMKPLQWSFIISIMFSLVLPLLFAKLSAKHLSFSLMLGLGLGLWVIIGSLKRLWVKYASQGLSSISAGAWGMVLAHMGVGVLVIGITVLSEFQIERNLRMKPGQTIQIAGYEIIFDSIYPVEGSNFVGYQSRFFLEKDNRQIAILHPEKRIFMAPEVSMTETALDVGFFRDFYIALGERLDHEAWSLRIYYNPFVRWIWLGGLMIALGGIIASCKRTKA